MNEQKREFRPPLPGWMQDQVLGDLVRDMREVLSWLRAGFVGLAIWQGFDLLDAIVHTSTAGAILHGLLLALWIWEAIRMTKRLRKYGETR